ncbi:MAG TPA: nuclease-related domain-containing protein [Dermatophilaceae bacterium]|nr:nuclease-related domain-containing protein [Dermatophilaceae bacterium]
MALEGFSAHEHGEAIRAAGGDGSSWLAGAEGERRVAAALAVLPAAEWQTLHDRLLLPGVTAWNLDHVVVGPAGVFLVDAKNWTGEVRVHDGNLVKRMADPDHPDRPDGVLRSLHRELDKVAWMAQRMGERLHLRVVPVLALAGERATEIGEPVVVRTVCVVSVDRLASWLQSCPHYYGPAHVGPLATRLMTEFPSTTTDPELLAAIGKDLLAAGHGPRGIVTPTTRYAVRPPAAGTRGRAPAGGAPRDRGPAGRGTTGRSPVVRTRSQSEAKGCLRGLVTLVLVTVGMVLLWAVLTAAIPRAISTIFTPTPRVNATQTTKLATTPPTTRPAAPTATTRGTVGHGHDPR